MEGFALGHMMQLDAPGVALRRVERPVPVPGPGEVLIKIAACGVCRTDLHIIDGEVPAHFPIVPGHELVGRIAAVGDGVHGWTKDQRVGVPWLGSTCGVCRYCRSGQENLCDAPIFTGANRDGGYASHVLADGRFCIAIPDQFDDAEAAPLLCAGLIGYRALTMAGDGERIGLYGFGAAAHIVAQVARWQGRSLYAFTRPGDVEAQAFAREMGCCWAGGSDQLAPEILDAAIIFAADGALVPAALEVIRKGGRVVCAGIHMSDIPGFPYAKLWEERSILSVANLTREDGRTFMEIAAKVPVKTHITRFPLDQANEALSALRGGTLQGAAVLIP